MQYLIVTIGYIFVMCLIALFFKVTNKADKDLHFQFLRKVAFVITTICYISLVLYISPTFKELVKLIFTCSSLLIAMATFAAQQALADVVAGFVISCSKPYNIDERITLVNSNITGVIEGITMRHTIIRLYDNNRLIIPNSVINKEIIKNSNFNDSEIGNFLEVSVAYESDIDKAVEVFQNIIFENSLVTNKEKSKVLIKDLADSGVILKATIMTRDVNDNFLACSQIRAEVLKTFAKQGIEIPYPHLKVITGEESKQ